MGFGRGGGKSKTDDYVNEEDISAHVKASVDKGVDGLSLSVPIIGKMISIIFSGNSAVAGLENEGIAGKMIIPSVLPEAQGGLLARILSQLGKNKQITDQTGGAGGEGGGGGGGGFAGGGGGGDFAGGGFSDYSFQSFGDAGFSQLASRSESFDWSPVAWASLGGLSSPLPVEAPVIEAPSRGGSAELA